MNEIYNLLFLFAGAALYAIGQGGIKLKKQSAETVAVSEEKGISKKERKQWDNLLSYNGTVQEGDLDED